MDREKLIKQLFVGKITAIIGYEKTTELLKEATISIDEMIKSRKGEPILKEELIKELELLVDSFDSYYPLEMNGYKRGVLDALDVVSRSS